ncbi:MAG: hypothetical protein RJA70_1338 [Pseudomonadota bacterium]|jgi:hypothetical protein
MLAPVHPGLVKLIDAYKAAEGYSRAQVLVSALVLAVIGGAHLARLGSFQTRAGSALLIALSLLGVIWGWLRARRGNRTAASAIRGVIITTQPELGGRLLRALNLLEKEDGHRGESRELSAVHFERLLARAKLDSVAELGKRRNRLFSRLAACAVAFSILGVGVGPRRVLEGLNVLVAQNGRAPVEMAWLRGVEVSAAPPNYLRAGKSRLELDSAGVLAEGSQVSFRGRPRYSGRELVITDGREQVPFVDDGSGALVAHWSLGASAELRVAARFGDVLIEEPGRVQLHAQPDLVPKVRLQGAPAELELTRLDKLELRWLAHDDHSLSQVDLVLRSAGREERRTLERYASDKAQGSGGYVLYPDDPFFKRIFLPATIRVEARDSDPRAEEKWGQSDAITIRLPTLGQPHVERYQALLHFRGQLVDFLLARLELEQVQDPKQKQERRRALMAALGQLEDEGLKALSGSFQGLLVPKGWTKFAEAQLELLRRAFERKKDEIAATEQAVLAVDSPLGALSTKDAQEVAKQLGDVAEEAAYGAKLSQSPEERSAGLERLDLAISVLQSGAVQLQKLGVLGADLGSVALSDLDRVQRSREEQDFLHAELAALHMAARLHRPNPSFGAKGGGGGGVESGGGNSGGEGTDAEGSASDADSEFDKLAEDLAQLAQEHAEAIERTGSGLDAAKGSVSKGDLSEEAKRRADALRRAAQGLPEPGEAPGTSRASAALSREHAGAMAFELERLAFDEALESARRAQAAAEDAQRRGLDSMTSRELESLAQEVRGHMAWAEEQRSRLKNLTEQAAKQSLAEVSSVERELAERARRLSKEDTGKAALPEEVRERLSRAQRLMEDAAFRLSGGDGEVGLSLQQQAQRLLEESDTGQTGGEEPGENPGESGAHGGQKKTGVGGDVPDPALHNGAEDFRRRVLEGLGKRSGGRLSPAVRRYAEGLLR